MKKERKRPLVRIVVQSRRDGKREIFCHDTTTNRVLESGMIVWPAEVEQSVRELRQILDKAGNQVVVKHISEE